MKTFIISATIATLAATVSFAQVGDIVDNGFGKELTVIEQQTGSRGNTRVVLLNDRDQERKFTVKANGKVKGKGGKKLKANIAAMVEADLEAAAEAEEAANNQTIPAPGKGFNLVDCSFEYGVDRIVAMPHTTIEEGIKAQRDLMDILCAE